MYICTIVYFHNYTFCHPYANEGYVLKTRKIRNLTLLQHLPGRD